MEKKYQGLLFDLDGTLADTSVGIVSAVNAVLTELGFPTRSKEEIEALMGNGARNLMKGALPKEEAEDEELCEAAFVRYDRAYQERCVGGAIPYAGIKEAIVALKKMHIPMAVLSNKQDTCTQKIVSALFGDSAFVYVSGQTDSPLKPDPEVPLQIAMKLGLSPSDIAVVGDSEVDIVTARNAGMGIVSVLWGYRNEQELALAGADVLIDSPQALLTMVQSPSRRKKKGSNGEKFTRMTRQKQIFWEVFQSNRDRAFTAEEILHLLDQANCHLGLATIYRNLKAFEAEGKLVRITMSADGALRYRYGGEDAAVKSYHKILCNRCGAAFSLPTELLKQIERSVCSATKYAITDHQILLYGVCPDCQGRHKKNV